MEEELREGIELYRHELGRVEGVLAAEPHNAEALQLKQQLQEALEFTVSAYSQAYGGDSGEQRRASGAGSFQFDSEENLAIAAAAEAGADHADPHGTGLADTAAAARAQAARTTKHKRAAQGSPGAGEQDDEEQQLDGHTELAARQGGGASATHSNVSTETGVAASDAGAEAEEERRAGHLTAGPSGREGAHAGPARTSSPGPKHAASLGGQQGRFAGAGMNAVSVGRKGRGNSRMHPSNRYYREEPDFIALSETYPELRKYMIMPKAPGGRAAFNYASWEGTRLLTATLLKADFGIDWWLPEGQLVPTVTNRANYIHWINDLLNLSSPELNEASDGLIEGLDIGCGTNLIYCLLGAAIYGWRMVGVDVTDVALDWAERHIEHNPHLKPLLEVRQPAPKQAPAAAGTAQDEAEGSKAEGGASNAVEQGSPPPGQYEDDDPGGIITPALIDDQETFAFSMCNPPFFESIEEANSNPATACGGSAQEMVYPGGELAFIMRMMEDSVRLGGRIHWYTTMVGKKTTLKALRKELHARHVTAIRTTELAQGKTSRWAIAWSFAVDPNLASVPISRPVNPELARPVVPKRSVTFQLKTSVDPRAVLKLIAEVLESHGASPAPSVDQGLWRVTAAFPPAAPSGPSGSASEPSPAGTAAGPPSASQAAPQAMTPSHRLSGGGAKVSKMDPTQAEESSAVGSPPAASSLAAASASAGASGGTSSTSPAEQQHKKPRAAAATDDDAGASGKRPSSAGGGAQPPAPSTRGPGLSARVTLFQVQKGIFEVSASVPNSAGVPEATRFTSLMQLAQSDVEAKLA